MDFVSVIIPVFNDIQRLRTCLTALNNQTYPQHLYEVIVVDNNSDEPIDAVVAEFEHVIYAFEAKQSSYAARNTGIAMAKGKILAFTDSDCTPCEQWLESGVNALCLGQADLAGGSVTFSFSPQRTAAELFDSITSLQVKKNIENRQLTVTANLFAHRTVFDAIGYFDSSLKSGGDFKWTKKATDSGFKLIYAPDAEISHPTRHFRSLVKKGYRVGAGQLDLQLDQNIALWAVIRHSIRQMLPPNPWRYRQFILDSENDEARQHIPSILFIAWICNIAKSLGRFNALGKRLGNQTKVSLQGQH